MTGRESLLEARCGKPVVAVSRPFGGTQASESPCSLPEGHGGPCGFLPEPRASLIAAPHLPVRQYTLVVTFCTDAVTVVEIKQAMEDAANALIRPTKDLASAVFTRGAEAVARAAQGEAERG